MFLGFPRDHPALATMWGLHISNPTDAASGSMVFVRIVRGGVMNGRGMRRSGPFEAG